MIVKIVVGTVISVIVVILGFVFFNVWQKHLKVQAGRILIDVNAVWAVQGPFKNGEESAKAMRYATEAVRGPESIKDPATAEAILKHAASYDEQPQKWESLRQECLSGASGQKFEEHLAIAKKLGAMVNPNNAASHTPDR